MNILFDLDGTICNTEEGVVSSALFALLQMNKPAPSRAVLRGFIGPPIRDSFMKICGLTGDEAICAIKLFRQRYGEKGKFENEIYHGMKELFVTLIGAGHKIYVATSKMEKYAVEILEKHGVDKLFTVIRGSSPDGKLSEKADIVQSILEDIPKNEKSVLVGDTVFDIIGAHKNQIPCVAVGFGFGEVSDLETADKICSTVEELGDYLLTLQ